MRLSTTRGRGIIMSNGEFVRGWDARARSVMRFVRHVKGGHRIERARALM